MNTKIENRRYSDHRFRDAGLDASTQAGEWQQQFNRGVYERNPPSNVSQQDFEQSIVDNAERYQNDSEYHYLAINGKTNSNSFVGSILREVYRPAMENAGSMTAHAAVQIFIRPVSPDTFGAVGWGADVPIQPVKDKSKVSR